MMKTSLFESRKLPRTLLFSLAFLLALLNTGWARAGQVTLSWEANTEPELTGYKIYYGTASNSYSAHIDVKNVTTYTVGGLTEGQTYYFAATAYAADGFESGYSNEVSYSASAITAPATPNQAPTVSAGASQTVDAGAAVVLTGTASDPENAISACQWTQTGGAAVALNGAQSLQASFTAPAIATGTAVLTFEFKATDSGGLSAAGTCTVTVQSPDLDGDGVPNTLDAFKNDPREWRDADGDGIGDNADPDDDSNGIPDADENNPAAPAVPELASPIDKAVVNPAASLKTGPFRSPVAGVTHAKSRWQIFREDDDFCVLDTQSSFALTSLWVPKLVLDEETQYYWRVQHIDSKGLASPWSDDGYFSTQNTGRDRNANGIPDSQEVGPKVDLDKDGVKDNQQATIKSVKVEGATVQVGVGIKDCTTALAVESAESEAPGLIDSYAPEKPKQMPFGLINFKIAVARPGDRASVKLYLSEPAPRGSQWYKYDSIADRWYDFSAYAIFADNRRSVTLTLEDGGPGDADGVANGLIVDPAGIGVEAIEEAHVAQRR